MSMKKVDVHTKKEKGGRMHVHEQKWTDTKEKRKKKVTMHVHEQSGRTKKKN